MLKISRIPVTAVLILLSLLSAACTGKAKEIIPVEHEGEVIFYTASGDDFFRQAGKLFQEKYGIRVVIVIAQDPVIIRKIINEKSLNQGTVDLYLTDSGLDFEKLDEADSLSTAPASIPGSEKISSSLNSDKILPLYSRSAVFAYDSKTITRPPETWEEFNLWLGENPDRFGFTATEGKAGLSFKYSVMSRLTGGWEQYTEGDIRMEPGKTENWNFVWEWFSEHREEYILTSSDYESLRLLSSGKLWLTTAFQDDVLSAQDRNEISDTIRMYIPEFGGLYMEKGIVIPRNSPNRNRAELFSAFLISPEMQDLMKKMVQTESLINSREAAVREHSLFPLPDPPYHQGLIEEFRKKVLYN